MTGTGPRLVTLTVKACPLMAMAQGIRECVRENCAWWADVYEKCLVEVAVVGMVEIGRRMNLVGGVRDGEKQKGK